MSLKTFTRYVRCRTCGFAASLRLLHGHTFADVMCGNCGSLASFRVERKDERNARPPGHTSGHYVGCYTSIDPKQYYDEATDWRCP